MMTQIIVILRIVCPPLCTPALPSIAWEGLQHHNLYKLHMYCSLVKYIQIIMMDMLVVVLVASTAVEGIIVLPFWNFSDSASVFTGVDDGFTIVTFSMPFHFNNNTYNNAYVSYNNVLYNSL